MQVRYKQLLLGISLSCLMVVGLSGCASTTTAGAVEADRPQLLMPGDEIINTQATQIYKKELEEAEKKELLNPDAEMLLRVQTIVDRLVPHTVTFREDAPSWEWEVNVIKSADVNAYCYPGGKMIVLTGIIEELSLNDDELAAILGHEIAHALREHTRERKSQSVVADIFSQSVGTFFGPLGGVIGSVFGNVVLLGNNRSAEIEADRIGVELMARAGYNPQGAVTLWEKMKAHSGEGDESAFATFLSTHPADDERIQTVTKDAQTVYPLYEAAIVNLDKETDS